MITAIFYGLVCVLLLRWIVWGTTRLFEQEEEELYRMCSDVSQDGPPDARLLSCLIRNGLSE